MENKKDEEDETINSVSHSYYHYTNYAYYSDVNPDEYSISEPNQLYHMNPGGCLYISDDEADN
tara:strand:+ start:1183 stop:1371 length:189 start_codon:yes stop_codon:yes gene_type:complete